MAPTLIECLHCGQRLPIAVVQEHEETMPGDPPAAWLGDMERLHRETTR